LEHQFLGLQGFAVGGTAFERDAFEEKNNHGDRTNSTHASFIGRIDSALNGNEESWHLLTKRAKRGELRQEWLVSYARVPVRMQPHIDSSLRGVKKKGEKVVAVSKHGDWLEILDEEEEEEEEDQVKFKKKEEKKDNLKTLGWMLTTHPEFGDLLKFMRGSHTLPAVNQVLATKEASDLLDHEHMVTIDYSRPRTFRVVSKSWVPVRIRPKLDAHTIGGKHCDEIIRVDARRGDWVRLNSEDFPPGYFKWHEAKAEAAVEKKEDEERGESKEEKEEETKKKDDGEEDEGDQEVSKECWMLTVHPEKGVLLEECRADGSDFISKVKPKVRQQEQHEQKHKQQKRESEIGRIPRGCESVYTASDVIP